MPPVVACPALTVGGDAMTTMFAAVEVATEAIDWFELIVGLVGGLALFLLGMERMTDSLRIIVGDSARRLLTRLTRNRFVGLLAGAALTAVVQSSSVTTVLVVGFVSAGLMTLIQSIPVVLGSNIGTTVTAQIIAFNVTSWALVFVAVGFLGASVARRESHRAQATALMGLGLLFFGMVVMSEAMAPLRTYQPFIDAMASLDSVLLGILVGAVFTALVQSSSATVGVVIVLAGQGLITLDAGIALILGSNIGTSVTAVLAAIGKPRDAQRTAAANVVFNVVGVLMWLPLIGLATGWIGSLGGGTPREIANAHTMFNVVNALVFLPFVAQFAALVTWLLPYRRVEGAIAPRYIDLGLLRTPTLALAKARMEMLRMASRVRGMLVDVLPAMLDGDIDELQRIREMDDEVDALHGLILEYLGQISRERLSEEASAELVDLLEATNSLEAVGDIIETNLVGLGRDRIMGSVVVSHGTRTIIERYHREIIEDFDLAIVAMTEKDVVAARSVADRKSGVRRLERDATERYAARLIADAPNRVATYRFETDVVTHLKRVNYFTRRIARVAVPEHEQATM
jgi:phosphate:Na+ symporter